MASVETPGLGSDPSQFVLEVCTNLPEATVRTRWQDVNRLLQLSAISGQQMQLDATLTLLCEYAKQMSQYDRALVYFWNEKDEVFQLRGCSNVSGIDDKQRARLAKGNVIHYWALRHSKPMLLTPGRDNALDELFSILSSRSAVAVPVFVNNRVMGSLQFFAEQADAFSREDAQLLWVMVRVAENLLTRESASEGLIHFAFTDHLTGLRTRGYFEQQLELEMKRSERNQQPFVLLMLDIDHFKVLNDTFGHHVGDVVLKQVAHILTADMREVDTVARYGGEEFVIILPETTEDEGHAVAQRIRHAVEQADYDHALTVDGAVKSKEIKKLSISIGLSVFDPVQRIKSKKELVESADSALYTAKSSGRNRVVRHRDLRTFI